MAPRGRQSGAGLKPPQAAVVKSDGGERCGNVGTWSRQARLREASASEPPMKCRKRIRRCRNRGVTLPPGSAREDPEACPSGMPGRRARELCAELTFVSGHFTEYQRLGDAAIQVLGDYTPLVERISIDEAFADVAGCTHLFGPPADIAKAIRRR